jgi:1,4-alpha-glucan branching enzyme
VGDRRRALRHAAALRRARADGAEFVAAVADRVAGGGVCVCALDTELLGHWWYEGPVWLRAVLEHARRAGLRLTTLDDALARHEPRPLPDAARGPHATSWGAGEDLRTWSGPRAAAFAWRAFLHDRALAGDYPEQRAAGHAEALQAALDGAGEADSALRGLAPRLDGWS